jgi:sorting nexin-9/18/33
MAEFQARALYEFTSAGEGELSLVLGEEIIVTNTEVGDGWWQGRNNVGQEGIFPEAYVEVLQNLQPAAVDARSATLGWGDEWDDSDDDSRYEDPGNFKNEEKYEEQGKYNNKEPGGLGSTRTSVNLSRPVSTSGKEKEAIYMPFQKFAMFGKTGAVENFLTGKNDQAEHAEKNLVIVTDMGDESYYWENTKPGYSCAVGMPKKGSKFGGLKTYMTYAITPSFSQIQVSRRYKHFDWLHERLVAKFGLLIPIPPLPDKQLSGLYEAELIDKRMKQLQSFVDRVCRHPVLAHAEVWRHFISETDEKRWTSGHPFYGFTKKLRRKIMKFRLSLW